MEVFVERDVNRPCSAFAALIAASQRGNISAIAVSSPHDFGQLWRVQELTRQRLERETGARVLIVTEA